MIWLMLKVVTYDDVVLILMIKKHVFQLVGKGMKEAVLVLEPVKPTASAQASNINLSGRVAGEMNAIGSIGAISAIGRGESQRLNTTRRDLKTRNSSQVLQVVTDTKTDAHVEAIRDVFKRLVIGNKLLHAVSFVRGETVKTLLVGKVVLGLTEDAKQPLVEVGGLDGDVWAEVLVQKCAEARKLLADVVVVRETIGDKANTLVDVVIPAAGSGLV